MNKLDDKKLSKEEEQCKKDFSFIIYILVLIVIVAAIAVIMFLIKEYKL